jgi:hypothetical protein
MIILLTLKFSNSQILKMKEATEQGTSVLVVLLPPVAASSIEQRPKQVPRRDATLIVTPSPLDIMCGTGHEKHHTAGSDLFKRIVSQFIEPYANAQTKKDKMQITKTILDLLTQRGVRFLKKEVETGAWYVTESKVARDKVGHFLRLHLPKNYDHQTVADAPCSSSPFFLNQEKEGFQSQSSQRTTPLSHFLGDVNESVKSPASGIHNALESCQISSIWNTIMDDTTNDHSKSGAGGYDYSRSSCENRKLHQTLPSSTYQGHAPLHHQGSCSSASSASTASFSKIKSEPLFATKAASSVLSNATHCNHHHPEAVRKKDALFQPSLFQKSREEEVFRLSKDTTPPSTTFNKNYIDTALESLPTLDVWGDSAMMLSPSVDGWSRLSWSSCGTIGNKSTGMADTASMEDLFDESDLAMRLD